MNLQLKLIIHLFQTRTLPSLKLYNTWAETQEGKDRLPSINLYYGAFVASFRESQKFTFARPNCAVRFHWRLLHHRQYRRASQGLRAGFFRGLMGDTDLDLALLQTSPFFGMVSLRDPSTDPFTQRFSNDLQQVTA